MKKIENLNIEKIISNPKAKIILMCIAALLVVIALWYKAGNNRIIKDEKSYATFAHTDPGITKEETFKGLKFTNVLLMTDKGYTTFYANVTNISEKESEIDAVYIDLKDKNGKTLISLKANIDKLAPKATTQISTTAKGKFKEAISKEIREFKSQE